MTGSVRIPTGPFPTTGPVPTTGPIPTQAPEALRETLKREINKRYAFLVIGAAVLAGATVIGLLAQRSCGAAGRGGEDAAVEGTLAKRKLLEDGNRLLAQGDPAAARTKFLELVRLAPESAAARDAVQKSEALLAKKQDDERRAAEVGAYLAEARRARDASEWAKAVVEADGALALDASNAEAQVIRSAAQGEIAKQSRAAQRKAAEQIRLLKSAPKPRPTLVPTPVETATSAEAEPPAAAAAPPGSLVRLRIAFRAPVTQGYVMIRRNDVEIWRRTFDFGRKSGGGSLEGEVEIAAGAGEFKAWVIATDRSVNEYVSVPLIIGDGRTLSLDVDAQKKLAVSLR